MSIRFRAPTSAPESAKANVPTSSSECSIPASLLDMAAPVQRDQELELSIESLAFGGNGVARLDGFVVVVRRGLPGDTVKARVTKVQRRHAEAVATEILTPGPVRVEAPCAHYPACGGCRFQDLAYDTQVQTKHQWVADSLQRIAGLTEAPLEAIVPAASQFYYRNKMEYSFTQLEDGPTLGLHRAGRWDEVLQIDKCWITSDVDNAIRNTMREWALEEKLTAYDQETHEGYLRHLMVRVGRNTGQALVQLVTNRGERFDRERLIEVLTAIPEVKSIHWSVNEGVSETTELPTELIWGEDAIEEEIGGLRFRVRPNAFLQTNTEMAEKLYAIAREFAGLTGNETVYDLYCGIGTIGISMARDAMTVWGIEISEESVACAIENQELNGIGNTAFFAGNVGEVLADLRQRAGDPDVVVVDPPRAGLAGKALKRLGEIAAPRIVYVSCNPTTLAGDLKRLSDDYGYRLVRARPVDMFPHTPHVECVALLER
jgi:23S rRNA (uracil1939-C5)-methyltransferase